MAWAALLLVPGSFASSPQSSPCERHELFDPASTHWDRFGHSVAIDSQYVFVGVPRHNLRHGGVHVYSRAGVDLVHLQHLKASDSSIGNLFGWTVDVDGERLVVGAPNESGTIPYAGSAYVFEQHAGTWLEAQKLVAPSVGEVHFFGWAVAISGNTIVCTTTPSHDPGVGHVFVHNGSEWVHQAKLRPLDPVPSHGFGTAVALEGHTAMIAAVGDGNFAGAVYVFERTGTIWVQRAKLAASNGIPGDVFGVTIALDGDRALIGSERKLFDLGTAYAFERINQTWVETQRLEVPGEVPGKWKQLRYVALDGDIAVAAERGTLGPAVAHVFDRVGATWIEMSRLVPKTAFGAQHGVSVAALGGSVLLGNPSSGGPGRASLFLLDQALETYCTAKPNSLGCEPAISFQGCPAASIASGFHVLASDVRNHKPGILIYGTNGRAAIPFSGGTMCVAPPLQRTPVVDSGGWPKPYYNDCTGVYAIDLAAFANGALGGNPDPQLSVPGTVVNCQWWGRDLGASHATTLSNALEYTVMP
jgi:hypothetical protein